MKPLSPNSRDGAANPRAIERAAADWLARRDRGLSAVQEEQFRRWLDADERHARIFVQMRETWTLLDDVNDAKGAIACEAELDRLPSRPRMNRRWVPIALAAAAAIAFAYIGSSWRSSRALAPFSATAATEIGRMEIVNLPDGSLIQLNTDSAVEVCFGISERTIELVRGEAHFVVAKDSARPFVVSADRVAVRAVGTAFNVRLRAAAVEVLVTEGRVRVDSDTTSPAMASPSAEAADVRLPPLLDAGQKVTIMLSPPASDVVESASVTVAPVAQDEIGRTLAWRQQRLDFVSVPLADIVAEFNRYNRTKLVIADAELAARQFGGTFRADEPDTFVRLLQTTFGVLTDRRGEEISLRSNR